MSDDLAAFAETAISEALTPTLTVAARQRIFAALWTWFAGIRKASVEDLSVRIANYQRQIKALADSLEINFEQGKFTINPGPARHTYSALCAGTPWFDGNRDEVDALIISTSLEKTSS